MRVQQRFEVPASCEETYRLLIDLERVAACIPGGQVGPRSDDGAHPASIAIKLGPMRMTYAGNVRLLEAEEAALRAVLEADVREQRGQGSAKARMEMAVSRSGAGALVDTTTEVNLTGRAAQMGQGVIEEVAGRLVADMASCIAAQLAPAPGEQPAPAAAETKPINGVWLMLRALWERVKRAFGPSARGDGDGDAGA